MSRVVLIIGLLAMILVGCSGSQPPAPAPAAEVEEPTPVPFQITTNNGGITVQGHLVPARVMQLSFPMNGRVDELGVQEGQQVKEGDLLARLGNREQLEAKLTEAKLDLLFAQQDYEDLEEQLPEAQTLALEELYVAQETLRQAESRVGTLSAPAPPSSSQVEIARANVAIAKKALDRASNDYRPYANKPEDNLTRAALLQKLATSQERYNRAVERLNGLLGGGSSSVNDIDQAETELTIAQAHLAQAQEKYELLLKGPDPQRVAATQARIEAAHAAMVAAETAMLDLELRAPMDGLIADLNLDTGQQVMDGQIIMTLADFSHWLVETDTLTEDQVIDVELGQRVIVVPNALPELEMTGEVDRISYNYQEVEGRITYTARIVLNEVDPRLRWGMQVSASFDAIVAQTQK